MTMCSSKTIFETVQLKIKTFKRKIWRNSEKKSGFWQENWNFRRILRIKI